MVLVDTSVWVGHLRKHSRELEDLLERDLVLIHSAVVGELACGSLKDRDTFLRHLNALPAALESTARETLELLQTRSLWGRGIGWVDAQLTASALITRCGFWTLDERLSAISAELGVKFIPGYGVELADSAMHQRWATASWQVTLAVPMPLAFLIEFSWKGRERNAGL